jgi:hypothetical protein
MSIANLLGIEIPIWQKYAKCREFTSDIFFPNKGERRKIATAKAVCNVCTVRKQCLEWIVGIESVEGEAPGIYGGLLRNERRQLKICKYKDCKKLRTTGRFCSDFHRQASLLDAQKASKKRQKETLKGLGIHGKTGQAQGKPRGEKFYS